MICTYIVITEFMDIEVELCPAHDKLEQKVPERAAELLQAKKGLEAINEELQIEIRNPKIVKDAILTLKCEGGRSPGSNQILWPT